MYTLFLAYFPLSLYYAFATAHLSCTVLKPRSRMKHPELTAFLFCAAGLVLSSIFKLYYFKAGTFLMQFSILLTVLIFFQGSLWQKLAAFASLFLTLSLVEVASGYIVLLVHYFLKSPTTPYLLLLSNNPLELILIPLTEIPLGILFYLKAVPLIKDFVSYFTLKTCLFLSFPVIIPSLANGLTFGKYQSPYFSILVIAYWLLCFSSYPLFFLGIRFLRKQEAQKLHQSRQLELVKKQLEFSKEMEHEYQELRKWNHDVQNHLLSLSYLMEMKNYTEAKAYTTSVLEAENPEHLFTGGHYEGKS